MKVVITGAPQSGQQQLFSLLTGISLETIQQKPLEPQVGICEVKDPRVTKLIELFKPKKQAYARIEYMLLPDFNLQGPAKELIFNQLKNADEICWITRSEADVSAFISELVIFDLLLVEKRIENIERGLRSRASEQNEKEKEFLLTIKKELDAEQLLRKFKFSDEQLKALKAYQFMTLKPIILAVNVSEAQIKDPSIAENIEQKFGLPAVQLCAELEQEIGSLDEKDRGAFMQEMGIEESALHKMTRLAYAGLGLISFFTVGEDEVRAWTVRKGSSAPEAGAAIHSDIAKGFVRAEMMKYDDFIAAGSEAKLKEVGKFYLKGRDYIVEDGDILSFRFNV
jgi:hypothetical protein